MRYRGSGRTVIPHLQPPLIDVSKSTLLVVLLPSRLIATTTTTLQTDLSNPVVFVKTSEILSYAPTAVLYANLARSKQLPLHLQLHMTTG